MIQHVFFTNRSNSNTHTTHPRSSALSGNPRHGQMAIEWATLMAVVVGACLVMAIYMKRGMSGRLRAATASIGEAYAPGATTSDLTTAITSETTTTVTLLKDQPLLNADGTPVLRPDGAPATVDITKTDTVTPGDTTTRTGTETVGPLGTDLWN